jgi:hypothetical protein
MNSLENPDPQSPGFGRCCNQCAHLTSPFCKTPKFLLIAFRSRFFIDVSQRLVAFEQWPATRTITLSGTQSGQARITEAKHGAGGHGRHRYYPERVVIYATCVPREWLPSRGAQTQQRWDGARPSLDRRSQTNARISKPSKCVPAAALEPLMVVTVTVGDEEPLPGS